MKQQCCGRLCFLLGLFCLPCTYADSWQKLSTVNMTLYQGDYWTQWEEGLDQCKSTLNCPAWLVYSHDGWCACSSADEHTKLAIDTDSSSKLWDIWYKGDCQGVKEVTGKWVELQSNPGPSHLTITEGVTRSYSVEASASWGMEASTSAQQGFKAFGIDTSVTVTGETSLNLGSQYSSTFQMSSTTTNEFDFGAGVVWQWRFEVTDVCGTTQTTAHDFAVTEGLFAPPCCLPGYAMNISKYHGPCHASTDGTTFNLCVSLLNTSQHDDDRTNLRKIIV